MAKHTVVVGNIGNVLINGTFMEAQEAFIEYRKMSKKRYGRCAAERVTWLRTAKDSRGKDRTEVYMEFIPRRKPCED